MSNINRLSSDLCDTLNEFSTDILSQNSELIIEEKLQIKKSKNKELQKDCKRMAKFLINTINSDDSSSALRESNSKNGINKILKILKQNKRNNQTQEMNATVDDSEPKSNLKLNLNTKLNMETFHVEISEKYTEIQKQMTLLTSKYNMLKMEKENVDNKLNLRENNSYTNQEKMKAELDACYSKIDYVTQNCNELDKKLYNKDSYIEELSKNLHEALEKIKNLAFNKEKIRTEFKTYKKEINYHDKISNNRQKINKEAEILNLQEKISSLCNKIKSKELKEHHYEIEINKMNEFTKNMCDKLKNSYLSSVTSNTHHQKLHKYYQESILNLQTLFDEKEITFEKSNKDVEKLNMNLKMVKEEFIVLKKKFDDQVDENKKIKDEYINEKNFTKFEKDQVEKLLCQNETYSRELKFSEMFIKERDAQFESVTNNIVELKKENEKLKFENNKFNQNNNYNCKKKEENGIEINQIKLNCQDLKNKLNNNKIKSKLSNNKIEKLQKDHQNKICYIDNLRSQLVEKNLEIENTKKKYQTDKVHSIEEKNHYYNQYIILKDDFDEYISNYKVSQHEILEMKKETNELIYENDKLKQSYDQNDAIISFKNNEIKLYQHENCELKEKIEKLYELIKQEKDKYDELNIYYIERKHDYDNKIQNYCRNYEKSNLDIKNGEIIISNLEKKINEQNLKIINQRKELVQLNDEIVHIQNNNNKTTAEIDQIKRQNNVNMNDKQVVIKKLKLLRSENKTYKMDKMLLEKEKNKLKDEIQLMEAQLQNLKPDLVILNKEKIKLESEINKMKIDNEKLNKQSINNNNIKTENEKEIDKLKTKIYEKSNEMKEISDKLLNVSEKLTKSILKNSESSQSTKKLKFQILQQEKILFKQKDENVTNQNKISKLEEDLKKCQFQSLECENEPLKMKLNDLEKKLSEKNVEYNKLKNNVKCDKDIEESLKNQIYQYDTKIKEIQSQLLSNESEFSQNYLCVNCPIYKKQLDSLISLKKEQDIKTKEFKQSINNLKQKLHEKKSQINEYKDECNRLNLDNQVLYNKKNIQLKNVENLEKEINLLNKKINSMQCKFGIINKSHKETEKNLIQVQKLLHISEMKSKKLLMANNDYTNGIQILKGNYQNTKKNNLIMSITIEVQNEKINEKNKQINELTAYQDKLQNLIKELQSNYKILENLKKASEEDFKSLQNDFNGWFKNECNNSDKMKDLIQNKQNINDELTDKIRVLSIKNDKLEKKLKSLMQQNKILNNEYPKILSLENLSHNQQSVMNELQNQLKNEENNNRKFKKESEQTINKLFHRLKNSLNLIENMNKKIKDLQNQSKLQCNETSPSILIQDFLRNTESSTLESLDLGMSTVSCDQNTI